MANEELAMAIRQVKSGKEFHFALIAKGAKTQLAMDKRKISGEEIAQMKKASGGGALMRGTCIVEDGTLIFMTSGSGSDAIGAMLKKMIKDETGLTMNCAFRASAAADEEEVESEDEAPAPAKSPAPSSASEPAKPAAAGPAPTPAAPEPSTLSKRSLMIEFADLVKANAARMKDQPDVAKLVRAIKAALDADKLADATTLIAALKRLGG